MKNPSAKSYHKLIIYKKAKDLVLLTYTNTSFYPKSETYNLVSQMRRAAVSVLANVIEGYAKESSAEYARFLTIAIGSITELEVYGNISLELGFINQNTLDKMNLLIFENKKLLYGTRKTIRKRIK